ncbi:MAG: N-acetylmuramoyl-L-alanine amidase [Candidatus Acidiferrales bacterium]
MIRIRRATSPTNRRSRIAIFAAVVLVCLASGAIAQQKKAAARAQFERAEKLRTALEGQPLQLRTLREFQNAVSAFHKVYLITPHAVEVPPALMAEAELYQEMGRQFDPQYFQNSIDSYRFLIKEYPSSRYRADALFTLAQIQQQDLEHLDDAESSFREFLQRFPTSPKADDARQAIMEIADARDKASQPASNAKLAKERAQDQGLPRVTNIRTWNAENYTRIVVDLEGSVKYESARIKNPDRIFFDLSRARLSPALSGKTFDLSGGYLRGIRLAQNQKGVVRLVLDVSSVKDYSAFLLPNPYRLVIDVHGETLTASKNSPGATAHETQVPAEPKPTEKGAGENNSSNADAESASASSPPAHEDFPPERTTSKTSKKTGGATASVTPPKPTHDGERSLTRTLGLKINRIVIDPGHGGQDTGTIGPHGVMEKDICLDVGLRLGKLIEEKLPGAEVIYTRRDDTFVPLEQRTAIANQEHADLFISVHANSSQDHAARGVETYYLNFATSGDAMEVAARENALSDSSVHDLQNILQKIARNDKIEESKELAGDIQDALVKRLQQSGAGEKSRGVKKAPFVVLIGANMPSVLSEISFLSNPADEKLLRRGEQREKVAEGIFRGIESYLQSLNSVASSHQKLVSEKQDRMASSGNPK